MNTKLPPLPAAKPKPQPIKPFQQSPIETGGSKSGTDGQPQSLAEHLDGALNFIADSLFSGGSSSSTSSPSQNNSPDQVPNSGSNPFAEALKKSQESNDEKDAELKKQKHLMRHTELQQKEVFNLELEKSKKVIESIKVELQLLIKEIKNVDNSVKTAVFMEEVSPGTYHVNFFTQLRNFLVLLRKRVREGATWAQMFQSKKQKSKYAQNSAKYGSKYMFGQEGQGLTRQNG